MSLRIAICCARRLFRDALSTCLSTSGEFTVVGHVSEASELLELCELSRPDVAVFDVGASPGLPEGLEELRLLRALSPETALMLAYDELAPEEFTRANRCGVDAFVPCSHGLEALLTMLRQTQPTEAREELSSLDRDILALVAAGHPVLRIAQLLGVSKGTVENRKRSIYHKLYVSGQNQAVAKASALGLLTAPAPPERVSAEGTMLVLLRGEAGLARDYVMPALVAQGVPFVVDTGEVPYQGPVVLALIDPSPAAWPTERSQMPMVLITSAPLSRCGVLDALDRGVSAVVDADRVPAEGLIASLTLAANGHVVLAVPQAHAVVGAAEALRGEAFRSLPDLTARESDILRSIACGRTVRQTARVLGIAEKTVENVQTRLFRKLGARNRTAALSVAGALGLLERLDEGGDRQR
ncbi:MAG TPA: LuxR C-terminal-related transcriptional regulator [Candidatus Limnocylindrales bacterium]|nr:LuxR C-terminal-related transcriptional regulator [Candidatus Limnocylindrales bacterium]